MFTVAENIAIYFPAISYQGGIFMIHVFETRCSLNLKPSTGIGMKAVKIIELVRLACMLCDNPYQPVTAHRHMLVFVYRNSIIVTLFYQRYRAL